jgi:hypothetical protein
MLTTSIGNKTTKVKRPKEGGFYVIFLGFILWWVCFSLYIFVKPKRFFISKNLVITYKLSTIKSFCHKVRDFVMVLIFLNFCHGLEEIAKRKECVASVNIWIHNGQLLTNHMFFLRFFLIKGLNRKCFSIFEIRCYFSWVLKSFWAPNLCTIISKVYRSC